MNSERPSGGLTLLEAVEALSAITEQHWEQGEVEWIPLDEEIDLKHPEWLLGSDKERARETVKELFKAVLNHLKHFYQNEYSLATNSTTLEGIKSLMVIVGEAAKKIDHYTTLFQDKHYGGATKLSEYKQLQEFYKKKISRTIDEALLGKWLLALTQRTFIEHEKKHAEGMRSLETRHVFVDLESVKQDRDYELFFIKKEDGTRFFNPRIIRNIKLISDFGLRGDQTIDEGLFVEQKVWEDRAIHDFAHQILKRAHPVINQFYGALVKDKGLECQGYLNMAIMALLLAAGKDRLGYQDHHKASKDYFSDFKQFFRLVLDSRGYQKFMAYPFEERSKSQEATLKISAALLSAIFEGVSSSNETHSYLTYLFGEARKVVSPDHLREALSKGELWSYLSADFSAMKKMLKKFPNESIDKILEELDRGFYQQFDPWMQGGVIAKVPDLSVNNSGVVWHVLPAPTKQEYIHHASVIEEFQGLLLSHHQSDGPVLIINHQDRTDWREHARCAALENLEEYEQFASFLTVATIPKDTPFYWQEEPYQEEHQVHLFKEHLLEQIADNHGGLFLSEKVRKVINRAWLDDLFEAIHHTFFHGRNVLSKENRLNFIEIFEMLLEQKIAQVVGARNVFVICKDGVDTSITSAALKMGWDWCMNPEGELSVAHEQFNRLIYPQALFQRHRIIQSDRFDRMLGALRTIEEVKNEPDAPPFIERVHQGFKGLF